MSSKNSLLHHPVLRLADWASLVVSLNWVYEAPVPKDGQGKRENPALSAWLIRRGSVEVKLESGPSIAAQAGDWVLLAAGRRFQEFSDDAELLSICWKAQWPDGRNLFDHGLPIVFPASQDPALEEAAIRLLAFSNLHLQHDPLPTWRLRASVRVAAETFLEGETLMLEWQRKVIGVLATHKVFPALHEIPDERVLLALEDLDYLPMRNMVKVEQVAAKVGLSTSQLNRLFSRYMGHTPKQHIHLRRVSEAKHLVQSKDMPIKEISYQMGFASQSSFSHWFTKETGHNPKAFAQLPTPQLD